MSRPLVLMEGVSKSFGAKLVLDRASLDLMEGEILGLVGDNGAGKSTLLKILAGVLAPDGGRIYIEGKARKISSPRRARALGIEMVYQDLALCGGMTVWENLFLGRYLMKPEGWRFLSILDKTSMARQAQRVIATLGVPVPNPDKPIRSLSGGQQQAVAMGRCLVSTPRVLLMDEPTASMAVKEKDRILETIVGFRSVGRSIVMVTHNLPEIFQVADRVLVLKEGRSIWAGSLSGMSPEDLAQLMFTGKRKSES